MAASLTESVTDLEIKVAYQDRAVADLDEVVRTLHRRVEALEQALAELRQSIADAPMIGPGNDPPPHY